MRRGSERTGIRESMEHIDLSSRRRTALHRSTSSRSPRRLRSTGRRGEDRIRNSRLRRGRQTTRAARRRRIRPPSVRGHHPSAPWLVSTSVSTNVTQLTSSSTQPPTQRSNPPSRSQQRSLRARCVTVVPMTSSRRSSHETSVQDASIRMKVAVPTVSHGVMTMRFSPDVHFLLLRVDARSTRMSTRRTDLEDSITRLSRSASTPWSTSAPSSDDDTRHHAFGEVPSSSTSIGRRVESHRDIAL